MLLNHLCINLTLVNTSPAFNPAIRRELIKYKVVHSLTQEILLVSAEIYNTFFLKIFFMKISLTSPEALLPGVVYRSNPDAKQDKCEICIIKKKNPWIINFLPESYSYRQTCIVITDGEPKCYGKGRDGVKTTNQTYINLWRLVWSHLSRS